MKLFNFNLVSDIQNIHPSRLAEPPQFEKNFCFRIKIFEADQYFDYFTDFLVWDISGTAFVSVSRVQERGDSSVISLRPFWSDLLILV